MADGFLGRWSQRKQAVREGKVPDEPVEVKTLPVVEAASTPVPAIPAPAAPPLPTLQEAQALTAESDFKPFVAREVAPEVRNAAMKKLFADPQFNVMDGLDIYIDDYSKPDPLPESMLRQMASAQFLNLFEDEKKDPHSVAQSAPLPPAGPVPLPTNTPPEPGQDHDHPDLQLQPNHAAGPDEPGRGTE